MLDPTSAIIWLHYADQSYVATRLLWFTGLWHEAPVSAHRTLELYLKAVLVSHGEEIRRGSRAWGHTLSHLGTVCSEYVSDFAGDNVVRRLAFFQRYFDFVRYPSDPGSPDDGSLVWFSFDSNIRPLDELTAFIRPRIQLADAEWLSSSVHDIVNSDTPGLGYQRRALSDCNDVLTLIDCLKTESVIVPFDGGFDYDFPGC